MKINGFKLLKKGTAGIEVEGIDVVDSGDHKTMFLDGVKRTRNFPLSMAIRKAVQVLNYPFLVGTEHWDVGFAQFMKDDYSGPDKKLYDPKEPLSKRLASFWDSCQILSCKMEAGNRYKIIGEIYCNLCTVKATVTIEEASDSSLHSFVDEAIGKIMDLVQDTLSLPMAALGSPSDIRQIFDELSDVDEKGGSDSLSDDEAFVAMMSKARTKGFGIILDDNSLSQFALNVQNMEKEESDNTESTNAVLGSLETKEPSIFKETLASVDPEYIPAQFIENDEPEDVGDIV
jgi:hypothetical protein